MKTKMIKAYLIISNIFLYTIPVGCKEITAEEINSAMSSGYSDDAGALWLMRVIFLLTKLSGCFVVAWGCFKLGLAIKDENPDQKSQAIVMLVAGGLLLGLKMILSKIGILAY